ncbi:MAG: hypothetical protein R3195_03145 [Gemmatimonadota bacterium]|nr:hypothetical protein [Gemmatimonadota bacterium]
MPATLRTSGSGDGAISSLTSSTNFSAGRLSSRLSSVRLHVPSGRETAMCWMSPVIPIGSSRMISWPSSRRRSAVTA